MDNSHDSDNEKWLYRAKLCTRRKIKANAAKNKKKKMALAFGRSGGLNISRIA